MVNRLYPLFVYEEPHAETCVAEFAKQKEKLSMERVPLICRFHIIEASEEQVIYTRSLHKVGRGVHSRMCHVMFVGHPTYTNSIDFCMFIDA
jgi:hypothetical protein